MDKPGANIWFVDNAGATFLSCSPDEGSPNGKLCKALFLALIACNC